MTAAIQVDSLDLSFRNENVLEDIDLAVEEGEFCVVMGPSGGGKSMLLKSIVGLVTPDSGQVLLEGQDAATMSVAERDIGFVFQEFEETLFPHRTVGENIAFGLQQQKDSDLSEEEIDKRIDDMLDLLAISHTRDDPPPELSGGQQQRVELARQLVRRCNVMLLDDPLADLDYKLQKRMEIEMRRIHEELESTFLYVTHNQDQALKLADKLVILNDGQIEQVGTPSEVYYSPESAFVARFVGDSNAFDATVLERDDDTVRLETPVGEMIATAMNGTENGDGLVTVRPKHVIVGEGADERDNTIEATVAGTTYMGELTEISLDVPEMDRQLLAIETGQSDVPDGTVRIGWDSDNAQFFEKLSVTDTVRKADLLEL